MKREPWIDSALETICDAFVRGDDAEVRVPVDADMNAFCRVIQEESGGRTFVTLIGPSLGETRAVAHLANTLGLDVAREVGSAKILNALLAFFDGLLSIGARCLVVLDGQLTGNDERTFDELHTRAILRQLPFHVVQISRGDVVHEDAVPVEALFDHGLTTFIAAPPERRLRLVAAGAVVLVALASTAFLSWHRSTPAPARVAARSGLDVALPGSARAPLGKSLGTVAHDGERTARPLTQIGVVDRTQPAKDTVLLQAERLARKPDVRGLIALRTSVEESGGSAANGRQGELLAHIDVLLDGARRRQLALDHQRLSGTNGPQLQR